MRDFKRKTQCANLTCRHQRPDTPGGRSNGDSRRSGKLGIAAAAICLVLLATACAPQNATSPETKLDIKPAITKAIKKEGLVRFHDGQYMASGLQAHLMANLVEAIGGKAEVVATGQAQGFAAMCKSDNMVAMDFWPWQYKAAWNEYVVKDKCVTVIDKADYKGEEGWYVPTYVIKGDPERGIEPMCPGLPDWKALNKCVDVFKTPRTAPKGQYMSGVKSWAPVYGDPKRIKNLGLDYEIVFAGSEAALFAELTRAYEQGEPWLGLMWRPNYMTHKYDLTRVEFPPYSDKCWGTTYACQWPETTIYQIASTGLPDKHPTLWKILKNYALSNEQLKSMQTLVVEEGMSAEKAAKTWMKKNAEVWKTWLP